MSSALWPVAPASHRDPPEASWYFCGAERLKIIITHGVESPCKSANGIPEGIQLMLTRHSNQHWTAVMCGLMVLALTLRSGAAVAPDPDLPGATADNEVIPAGSLVIPMDNDLQALKRA